MKKTRSSLDYKVRFKHLRPVTVRTKDGRKIRRQPLAYAFPMERRIEIHSKQRALSCLVSVIHEMLHIEFPEMAEKEVIRLSNRMARCQWRLGFRRIYV